MDSNRETLKHSSIFSLFTSLSRILGLARDMLKAYAFGTGPLSVAFDIAFRLNNMLRNLVAEGALSQAFVPLYNKYAAESRNKADEAAGVVIVFVSIAMTLITALIIFLLPAAMPIILAKDKVEPEQMRLIINLSQLLFPYLVMMSVASLYMGIQYAHKIFWAASFGPALLNIVILVIFGAYVGFMRVSQQTFGLEAIYVFSLTTLVAAAAQVFFQIWTVHRRKLTPKYSLRFRHDALRSLGSLMLPAVFAASLQEFGQLIDVYLATSLAQTVPEAISALTYSHRLIQLPIGIFGVAVATASLSQLSKIYQTDKTGIEFSENLTQSIRLNFFFLMPAISGLMIFSTPIVELIFERGAFTKRSTEVTATALLCYAPGILAYSLQKLATVTFYARMNSRTPAKITALTLFLNFALSLALMQSLLHGGLALGSALAAWCGVTISFSLLLRQNILNALPTLSRDLLRIFFTNLLLVGFLLSLRWALSSTKAFTQLMIAIPLAVVFYFFAAKLLRIQEVTNLIDLTKKLTARLKRSN